MSNISAVSGTSFASFDPAQVSTLDSDTLLTYCAVQLNDLNSEIKARMGTQQGCRTAKTCLNAARAVIGKHATGGTFTKEEKTEVLRNLALAYKALPPGQLREEVLKQLNEFRTTTCYNGVPHDLVDSQIDGYLVDGIAKDVEVPSAAPAEGQTFGPNDIDGTEGANFNTALQDIGDGLNKNAELDMIGLQSLISQRQMAVQTTTNLMSKLNQTLEVTAQNLK